MRTFEINRGNHITEVVELGDDNSLVMLIDGLTERAEKAETQLIREHQKGWNEGLEKAALLFDPYSNGHVQEFHGGAEDSVAFTFRVMTIIGDNILALRKP